MNIIVSESPVGIVAKTCGCRDKRGVTYQMVDSYHSLCMSKQEIWLAEVAACQELLAHTVDEADRIMIEVELDQLKMALDLLP